jgi:hypothetical protein
MTDASQNVQLPNIPLPTFAQLAAFVANADAVLGPFASIPQVAFVHRVVVPLLEGALTIAGQLQSGSQDTGQMQSFISAELQRLSALIHPQA